MFLFGILQGNAKTNWISIVIVGIGYFIVYYLLFGFLIKRFDLKTPGRDDSEEVKLYRRSDVEARKNGDNGSEASSEDALSQTICQGLGGKKNISDVDCCATRLRCTVHKAERVDDALLKSTGASGVVHKGNGVQIIYGPRVSVIKSNLEDYLETAPTKNSQLAEMMSMQLHTLVLIQMLTVAQMLALQKMPTQARQKQLLLRQSLSQAQSQVRLLTYLPLQTKHLLEK